MADYRKSEVKPLFVKGSSLMLRLVLFAGLSIALLILDTDRFVDEQGEKYTQPIRDGLEASLYPFKLLVDTPNVSLARASEYFTEQDRLVEENRQIRTEQLRLNAQLQKLADLKEENTRLRELVAAKEKLEDQTIAAELMAVDVDPFRHIIVINKGSENGAFDGQAILDSKGMMGQVTETGHYSSNAILITDANHALPIEVNRNGLRTIARGVGEIDRLELPYLSNNADVQEGDLLVSSGLGGRFPPGYPVAVVTRVERDPAQRFATVSAKPTARLDRSREVLLVWSPEVDKKQAADNDQLAAEVSFKEE